jgi:hypothetical protein
VAGGLAYFRRVGQAIRRHGGYIDTYMGDGLMALFGIQDPDNVALRAVWAGLDMLAAVEQLNPYLTALYQRELRIGIGVHVGDVVVGAVGAGDNRKVTAIGDAVNLTEQGQRFAVIGGGFIGSEIAAALAMNRKDVVMLFPGTGIGDRVFGSELSAFLNEYYRQHGVEVLAGETAESLERRGTQIALRTAGSREAMGAPCTRSTTTPSP